MRKLFNSIRSWATQHSKLVEILSPVLCTIMGVVLYRITYGQQGFIGILNGLGALLTFVGILWLFLLGILTLLMKPEKSKADRAFTKQSSEIMKQWHESGDAEELYEALLRLKRPQLPESRFTYWKQLAEASVETQRAEEAQKYINLAQDSLDAMAEDNSKADKSSKIEAMRVELEELRKEAF